MCKALSCIALESGRVVWKLGTDSHEDLLAKERIKDNDARPNFARVEIAPESGDYRKPIKWVLKIDENATPAWWSPAYEAACWDAHKGWCEQLYAILDTETVIANPFWIVPPKKITKKHLALLRKWASVWDSLRARVWDSVWDSVRDSVRASVGARAGSLFRLPRGAWKYTDKIKCKGYPFQPSVDLWNLGLVPSFDGKVWRMHGGPKAAGLFEITQDELQ
jgi:hypothetical protein